jgi:hypothetical protein
MDGRCKIGGISCKSAFDISFVHILDVIRPHRGTRYGPSQEIRLVVA